MDCKSKIYLDRVEFSILSVLTQANSFSSSFMQPLHEGARSGNIDIVKYLVENGADVNVTTGGSGASALWWAKSRFEDDHPVIAFLEELGAIETGPDL